MADRAEQLLLDDAMDIDQKATANKVRNFLKFDFDRYLNFAGLNPSDLSVIDDTHLSSPSLDASGVSSHGGINHAETSMLRIIEAENACKAIYHAIMKCRDGGRKPYKTILSEVYLKGMNDTAVQGLLGYESSQYDVIKRRALCEFADRWDRSRYIYRLRDDKWDMHVWKK